MISLDQTFLEDSDALPAPLDLLISMTTSHQVASLNICLLFTYIKKDMITNHSQINATLYFKTISQLPTHASLLPNTQHTQMPAYEHACAHAHVCQIHTRKTIIILVICILLHVFASIISISFLFLTDF